MCIPRKRELRIKENDANSSGEMQKDERKRYLEVLRLTVFLGALMLRT